MEIGKQGTKNRNTEEWKLSAISLLVKDKDNIADPTKYRPIALLDTLYKIYTSILSDPSQAGSLPNRSTYEQITSLLNTIEDKEQVPEDNFAIILTRLRNTNQICESYHVFVPR